MNVYVVKYEYSDQSGSESSLRAVFVDKEPALTFKRESNVGGYLKVYEAPIGVELYRLGLKVVG